MTDRRSIGPDRRMTPDYKRAGLLAMGFTHVVVIAVDVSVRTRGTIEAAFRCECDATHLATRLCHLYSHENAFVVEQLS